MSRVQTGDSFSMKYSDQQKIADLEYLLQKAAEEISKLNEQNEYLENMNSNSSNMELTQLKQQLEQKQKQIKKLQMKCINYENQLRENVNLKDSQETVHQGTKLKYKMNNNKENINTSRTSSLCFQQLNLKALEDAEQFLNEGRIYSSRIVKIQKSPVELNQTQRKIEYDRVIVDELKLELSNFAEFYQNLQKQVELNLEHLQSQLSQSKFNLLIPILIDNLTILRETNNQLKEQLNQSIQQNRQLISQFKLFLKFNQQPSEFIKVSPQDNKIAHFDKYNDLISKLTYSLKNLQAQYKQLQLEHIEQLKQNQILYDRLQEQSNFETLSELESIKNQLTNIFDDVEILNQEYELQEFQLTQIHKILDGQKIETDNSQIQEIQQRISDLLQENSQMKRLYIDIIYQIIARMIKDNKQQIYRKIESNQQFQNSLQWLLQSTKRELSFQTLQSETEVLRQFILQPQDYSQFNKVIDIQSRLIQKLLQGNNTKSAFNPDILQELRQFTEAIEGLPECLSERIDIKLLLKQ